MRPLRIFIVDDDRDFARGLAVLLELEGHHIELAFDGEAAVRKFRKQSFDVTFMDVRLPGMNGVESFFELRKIKPHAKVVMMTAYSVQDLLTRAMDGGALGVLTKPFGPDEVLQKLEGIRPEGIVLLADDDPDFVDSVERYLAAQGYNVIVARTGREAVDKVLTDGVDVLLLDLRLPVLSGLEVYLELKKKDRTVPTIIVTGYAAEEAQAIGTLDTLSVSGCLVKPIKPDDLIGAIEKLIDEPSAKIA